MFRLRHWSLVLGYLLIVRRVEVLEVPRSDEHVSTCLLQETRRWLGGGAAGRIVYVSHDQPAFAKDARALISYGYG